MTSLPDLDQLTPEQLRALAAQLFSRLGAKDKQIHHDKTLIEKLSHEIAQLKRFKYAKRSEQMSPEQASLLDDLSIPISVPSKRSWSHCSPPQHLLRKSKSPSVVPCRLNSRTP